MKEDNITFKRARTITIPLSQICDEDYKNILSVYDKRCIDSNYSHYDVACYIALLTKIRYKHPMSKTLWVYTINDDIKMEDNDRFLTALLAEYIFDELQTVKLKDNDYQEQIIKMLKKIC